MSKNFNTREIPPEWPKPGAVPWMLCRLVLMWTVERQQAYWCTCATDWAEIEQEWGLWMGEYEAEAVQEMLGTCTDPPVVEVVRENPPRGPVQLRLPRLRAPGSPSCS